MAQHEAETSGYLADVGQELLAHGAVEIGQRQALVEKLAVYVIKAGKISVQLFASLIFRRIELQKGG